eukprot:TRINITY_DN5750_c1_g1_i2.p1 TRINITY_DN5750_c1_g1~~TRINITY_DN5750_c1_g1_i2.p1  ORF type:complete len:126 (+),score=19.13 TRINITY_DN5750_c1_g1_i2:132-509(+)
MRALILSLLLLQLLLPGAFPERKPKSKPVMCKNPKGKEGSSLMQGCSKVTCMKIGKKGIWQPCHTVALEKTVVENQRKIDENHKLAQEILEILGKPYCCGPMQSTTWATSPAYVEDGEIPVAMHL